MCWSRQLGLMCSERSALWGAEVRGPRARSPWRNATSLLGHTLTRPVPCNSPSAISEQGSACLANSLPLCQVPPVVSLSNHSASFLKYSFYCLLKPLLNFLFIKKCVACVGFLVYYLSTIRNGLLKLIYLIKNWNINMSPKLIGSCHMYDESCRRHQSVSRSFVLYCFSKDHTSYVQFHVWRNPTERGQTQSR